MVTVPSPKAVMVSLERPIRTAGYFRQRVENIPTDTHFGIVDDKREH